MRSFTFSNLSCTGLEDTSPPPSPISSGRDAPSLPEHSMSDPFFSALAIEFTNVATAIRDHDAASEYHISGPDSPGRGMISNVPHLSMSNAGNTDYQSFQHDWTKSSFARSHISMLREWRASHRKNSASTSAFEYPAEHHRLAEGRGNTGITIRGSRSMDNLSYRNTDRFSDVSLTLHPNASINPDLDTTVVARETVSSAKDGKKAIRWAPDTFYSPSPSLGSRGEETTNSEDEDLELKAALEEFSRVEAAFPIDSPPDTPWPDNANNELEGSSPDSDDQDLNERIGLAFANSELNKISAKGKAERVRIDAKLGRDVKRQLDLLREEGYMENSRHWDRAVRKIKDSKFSGLGKFFGRS